jgi:hypothetical protein
VKYLKIFAKSTDFGCPVGGDGIAPSQCLPWQLKHTQEGLIPREQPAICVKRRHPLAHTIERCQQDAFRHCRAAVCPGEEDSATKERCRSDGTSNNESQHRALIHGFRCRHLLLHPHIRRVRDRIDVRSNGLHRVPPGIRVHDGHSRIEALFAPDCNRRGEFVHLGR